MKSVNFFINTSLFKIMLINQLIKKVLKGCFNVKIMVGFHLLVFSKFTLFFSLTQHLKKNYFH